MITRRASMALMASASGAVSSHAMVEALVRPRRTVVLTMSGQIGLTNRGAEVDWDVPMLNAMPQKKIMTKTPWDKVAKTFSGPLLRDVLLAVQARGQILHALGLNEFSVFIPAADAENYDVVVATRVNGELLSIRSRGPLMIMYPFDSEPTLQKSSYYERCVWQLRRLVVL